MTAKFISRLVPVERFQYHDDACVPALTDLSDISISRRLKCDHPSSCWFSEIISQVGEQLSHKNQAAWDIDFIVG